MVLVLNEQDVEGLVDLRSAVDAIEDAFREAGKGKVVMPVRAKMSVPDSFGTIRLMPAALLESKVSGLKVLAGTAGHRKPDGAYFVSLVHDFDDGGLKCIVSANRLTQLRTGAVAAVATRLLARKDSKTFGLIGAGVQGKGQLEAVSSVVNFEGGLVYDVSKESAVRLAGLGLKLGLELKVADSIEEVTSRSDVISTSTTASTPFLSASNVKEGTHINAMGSNLPSRKELDPNLLGASKVVVDSLEQAIEESGDLEPIRQGKVPKDVIHGELSEVLAGSKSGRESGREITILKSVGVALQDVAIANFIYSRALKRGVGTEVKL